MQSIPTTAREFKRWMAEQTGWPADLVTKGKVALLTLKSLDQPAAAQSPAFMEASRADLMAFAEAYGAWAATKGAEA